jgi:hypothetical protein
MITRKLGEFTSDDIIKVKEILIGILGLYDQRESPIEGSFPIRKDKKTGLATLCNKTCYRLYQDG